jgi:hypothetical protein
MAPARFQPIDRPSSTSLHGTLEDSIGVQGEGVARGLELLPASPAHPFRR